MKRFSIEVGNDHVVGKTVFYVYAENEQQAINLLVHSFVVKQAPLDGTAPAVTDNRIAPGA